MWLSVVFGAEGLGLVLWSLVWLERIWLHAHKPPPDTKRVWLLYTLSTLSVGIAAISLALDPLALSASMRGIVDVVRVIAFLTFIVSFVRAKQIEQRLSSGQEGAGQQDDG